MNLVAVQSRAHKRKAIIKRAETMSKREPKPITLPKLKCLEDEE